MAKYLTPEEADAYAHEVAEQLWNASYIWARQHYLEQGLSSEAAGEAADAKLLELLLVPMTEEEDDR